MKKPYGSKKTELSVKFNNPYITGLEFDNIKKAFEQNVFYGTGLFTKSCENIIANRLGVEKDQVLLTDSCTSALEITALLLKDWSVRDQEVILPSYTFTSTAAAFAKLGFRLVFADVDPKNMCICVDDVERKLTNKTVAVIGVHYGGDLCNVQKLNELCRKNALYFIEDAAQAYDVETQQQKAGTFGAFGCFSFHETKNLHCGLGGALVVNDTSFLKRAVHIRERGTNRQEVINGIVDKYSWVEIGGSFYPTELQAAFLEPQLLSVDSNRNERQKIFQSYKNAFLVKAPGLISHIEIDEDIIRTNYHAFWIMLNGADEQAEVVKFLQRKNISAYIGYIPLHSSQVGIQMGNKTDDLPVTNDIAKRILRLPIHNAMSPSDAEFVASNVIDAINSFRNGMAQ